jgi:hypothetical protein
MIHVVGIHTERGMRPAYAGRVDVVIVPARVEKLKIVQVNVLGLQDLIGILVMGIPPEVVGQKPLEMELIFVRIAKAMKVALLEEIVVVGVIILYTQMPLGVMTKWVYV